MHMGIDMDCILSGYRSSFLLQDTVSTLGHFRRNFTILQINSLLFAYLRLLYPATSDAVDTFFFLSAFLLAMGLLKSLTQLQEAGKSIMLYWFGAWPLLVFNRWLRVTPALVFVVATYTILLSQLAKGPYNNTVEQDIQTCKTKWWQNLLYINNILSPGNESCYPVTWYLAVDFQLYIILGPILTTTMVWSRYAGMALALALLVGSMVYSTLLSLAEDWTVTPISGNDFLRYMKNCEW